MSTQRYINSEAEALFYEYLRNLGLAPISIKNIRSDTRHIFKWLMYQRYAVAYERFLHDYEQYVHTSALDESVRNRRMHTARRFYDWYCQENGLTPIADVSVKSPIGQAKPVYSPPQHASRRPYIVLIILASAMLLFVAGLVLFRYKLSSNQSKESSGITANQPYFVSVILNFANSFTLSEKDNVSFLFRFYSAKNDDSYIGYTTCPFKQIARRLDNRSLSIVIGKDCGSLPSSVLDILAHNTNIYLDIYVNNVKLTPSKQLVSAQKTRNDKLTSQTATKDTSTQFSKELDALLNSGSVANLLPSTPDAIGSSAAQLDNKLPLSAFANGPSFIEGDVIGIVGDTIDRAILQSKVVGVVSKEHVITRGIAVVRILDRTQSIAPGDQISTSIEPGYAQKALSRLDNVFATAIEPFASASGTLRVYLDAR